MAAITDDSGDSGLSTYRHLKKQFTIGSEQYEFYDVEALDDGKYLKLPFCIRILLESAVRNCNEFLVTSEDVKRLLNWSTTQWENVEVSFKPARVLLQDFTGVPVVVDFAAMRDCMRKLGGVAERINPICPCDLVIDHSVQVDFSGDATSRGKNEDLEFERNKERFTFLKWGSKALNNMQIIPPGSGIVHQVNLEHLARVVFNDNGILSPDTVVGTDSHTTMINGLGVLGWGVGGIEAEAVMLGQATCMVVPHVIGYKIYGSLHQRATSTDLVLTITKHLRDKGVVGKFVEFFGPGVSELSVADRATISNMCPEYGATAAYFPIDKSTMAYLKQTGRSDKQIRYIEEYLTKAQLFRNYDDTTQDPEFTESMALNLATVVPSMSGPKRPEDRVSVTDAKTDFLKCLVHPIGFKGFNIHADNVGDKVPFVYEGKEYELAHGSVVIAAITSCTNTSNPSVMLGAGLLARNAVNAGLTVAPYIKTSLSPGSGVVTYYLEESKVIQYLEKLGFSNVGYGCMTCIGNSGPLPKSVDAAINQGNLVCCGVLSGNRNFEGRIHPNTRANYLASPLLVIAYAIAGTLNIDFEVEPLGKNAEGNDIFLRDIWPVRREIQDVERKYVIPSMFTDVYSKITSANSNWNLLVAPTGNMYEWDPLSTYIRCPPYFDGMSMEPPEVESIFNASVLLYFGDSVTTDHISPAGSIARNSPAARYLTDKQVISGDFNSYGSRRGNHEVMARGTFANARLQNELASKSGALTVHYPSGDEMSVFDVAERYKEENRMSIVLAGKNYGSGSSRDWAAKGPYMLGVRAVLAESFERIHRSNLIGMGILPLEFQEGQSSKTFGLLGTEKFDIYIPEDLAPRQLLCVIPRPGNPFEMICRIDTKVELEYFKHGGILQYVVRTMCH